MCSRMISIDDKSSIIENKNDNPKKFRKMINCIFISSNMGSIQFWSLNDSLSMQKITTTLKHKWTQSPIHVKEFSH